MPRVVLTHSLAPVLPELLLGLAAGLLTGILIAWYRRTHNGAE